MLYTTIIESILTHSIITWISAAAVKDQAKLQRVIKSAERVIGTLSSPTTEEGMKNHVQPHTPRQLSFSHPPLRKKATVA